MRPRSDLIDLLEIDHPVRRTPMGGGSTSRMVSAVCNTGGLGGLGCSFMSVDEGWNEKERVTYSGVTSLIYRLHNKMDVIRHGHIGISNKCHRKYGN